MKKIISLLVVLAMLMSMAPAVFAAEATQEQGDVVNLVLGNNELDAGHDWTPELTVGEFVATETGTLYITFRALYMYDDPSFNEWLLVQTNYVQLKVNGEFIGGREWSVDVTAGDVVTISLESMDGDPYHTWFNLSYDGWWEEPAGTVLNPVSIKPSECPGDTVTIPAGEEICYELYSDYYDDDSFTDDHIVYVYGENAYIIVNVYDYEFGYIEKRIDAVDGVVTYPVQMYEFRIGNAGSEDAVFVIDCEVPVGTSANPQKMAEGEFVVNMDATRSGYYFDGVSAVDGTLTVTVTGDSYWEMSLQNQGDPDDWSDGDYKYLSERENNGNTITIEVKVGDYLNLTLRLMNEEYSYCDGTLNVTFDFEGTGSEQPPVEPPVEGAEELTLGYNTVEVGAEGQTYTWTAEEDGLFALAMTSMNWTYTINGVTRSSADQEPVYMTVLAVTAGDVITLTIGTADGAAAEVSFSANVYAGTAANPVALEMVWNASQTAASLNADLPAGEYVYSLPIFGAGSLELTINGVVTAYEADPMGWDPSTVVINNESETNAVYSIKIAPPSGTMYNPDPLQMGYNEAELIYADYQMMRCYAFTAEEDTLLALSMMGDNWYFWGMMQDATGATTAWIDGYAVDGDPLVTMQVIKVAAGETFILILGTIDGSETVTFNAMTYAGTEADPVALEMVWNASQTAASLNVDLPAGEYVYSLPIFGAGSLELTINGVVTEFNADPMGWDPSTVVINNESETNAVYSIKIAPPSGTMYNPDPLQMGETVAELIYADYQMMRCYAFTAEEDTLLALTMMGDNWYFWGMMQDATGATTAWIDGHDVMTEPVVSMQVVKVAAGETFVLILGTVDGSETVTFNAMTYAGTEEDPIMVEFNWDEDWTSATLNIDVPAGEYVFGTRGLTGVILTANGEEIPYVPGATMRDPALFVLNNEGETNAVFELALSYPPAAPGTMDNPEVVEEGEHVVEIKENNFEGYFLSWTAEEDGVLTITVSAETFWYLMAYNVNSDEEFIDHWSDKEPDVNTFTINVKAGDEVIIAVNNYDLENGMAPAGVVTVNLDFTPAGQEETLLGDVNGDGKVDTTDAKLIMQYNLALIDETALNLSAADVNGDGDMDTTDAKLIMQLNLELIPEFPKN